jgi:arabinofuranan 3-O-arabinosyltransferase
VATSVLQGCSACGGHSAVDGDPGTAWQSAFGDATGASVAVDLGGALTVDHLDLQILNDGKHSVPTRLTVAAGGVERHVDLPAVPGGPAPTKVPVRFEAVTGNQLTVTIAAERAHVTTDRRSGEPVALPVSIAELGIPGYVAPPLPATFAADTTLTIDGRPVALQVTGRTADALAGAPLTATVTGVALGPGDHRLAAAAGPMAVDRVVLSSPAPTATVRRGGPQVTVTHSDRTHRTVTVGGASGPFWLVLGEGWNPGWHAAIAGHALGRPVAVDGGSNGWLLTPTSAGPLTVHLDWTPQQAVNIGLIVSGVAVVVCVVLVIVGTRRRDEGLPPDPPRLANPFRPQRGGPTGWAVAAITGIAVGAVTGFVIHPAYGVVAGVGAAVSLRWPRWRGLVTVGAVWGVVLTGVLYLARQIVSQPMPGFGWVSRFEFVHPVAFLAVALAVTDVVVERVRSGRRAGAVPEADETAP